MRIVAYARSIIAAIALALILTACGNTAPDPLAYQREQIALEQQQQAAQVTQARAAVLEMPLRVLLIALTLAPVGLLVAAADAYMLRRKLLRVDQAGRLPFPHATISNDPRPAIAALGAFHATELARATPARLISPPNVPALLTNSPDVPTPALPDKCDLLASLRTFTPSADQILMGVSAAGPVYRSLEQLMHTGVLGSSGSGKSTAQLAIACQLAMIPGASMAVLDPEAATFQALRNSPRLWSTFPEDGRECLANLQALVGELNSRRSLLSAAGAWDWREHNEQGGTMAPILGLVDELPSLMSFGDVEPLLLDLARRGRKVGMYLLVATQSMKREDIGSTTLRQQFATRLLLRTGETAQGRALGLDANWCKTATTFEQPGLAVFSPNDSACQVIRVPYVAKSSAAHILRGATIEQLAEEPRKALTSDTSLSSPLAGTPEITEVVQRMAACGLGQNRIIEMVWNLKPGGNDAYRQAREQYKLIVGEGAS